MNPMKNEWTRRTSSHSDSPRAGPANSEITNTTNHTEANNSHASMPPSRGFVH